MTVLVLGNITLDLVFRVDRFPQPGETVLASRRDVDVGGKGANQAVIAGRFGGDVRLVAAIGDDADGLSARKRLAAEAIDLDGLVTVAAATDQSVITVDGCSENSIVSSHAAAASLTPDHATNAAETLAAGDWLVVQGNLRQATTLEALSAAKRRGALTFFNPAPIQWDVVPLLPSVDVLVLNRVELGTLTHSNDPAVGGRQLRAAGAEIVVVTLGGDGVAIVNDHGITHLQARKANAVDTAGAGDTFCGALLAGLAKGADLALAARLGIEAAALTVTRAGTYSAFPSEAEASALMADMPSFGSGQH